MRASTGFLAALLVCACTGKVGEDPPESARGSSITVSPSAVAVAGVRCVAAAQVDLPSGETAPAASCTRADAMDEALASIELDRCTLALDEEALATSRLDANDPRLLPAFAATHRRPAELSRRGAALAGALDEALASPMPVARAIAVASAALGATVSVCTDAVTVDGSSDAPLALELGLAPSKAAGVPLELQRALVPVARAIRDADREVRASLPSAADRRRAAWHVPGWLLGVRRFELSQALLADFDRVDVARIAAAALRVAIAVESADLGRFAGWKVPKVVLPSAFGTFVLSGPENDVHGAETAGAAFVLDTGGDDEYHAPVATSGLDRAVSVAVDLAGHDRYFAGEAAGVVGIGLLFDLGEGNDLYFGTSAAQGAGAHGVGVLFDGGGDDTYEAVGFSQGAAAWGIGLLLETGGDDRYVIDTEGQGYGFTRGAGMLVDARGDDRYVANPGDPSLGGSVKFPSDQLPGRPKSPVAGNMSFSQGCGAGHRPDWPDPGYPLPGGLGVLRDAHGNDTYRASVFAQGCGYVQGVGMLLEGDGDDAYDGLYYVQGAAAHMAAGLLRDEAGADEYDLRFPIVYASLGMGHDLSVGVHYDGAGDDRYVAPGLSLGAGHANGIGVFVNAGGTDTYRIASQPTLGAALVGDAKKERRRFPTFGVFVRAGGRTSYTLGGRDLAYEGKRWSSAKSDDDEERGVGIDRPRGSARL